MFGVRMLAGFEFWYRRLPFMNPPSDYLEDYQPHPFDARAIGRRFRHAAIFGVLEALGPGEAMRFVNDHDPLPLLAQMENHFGERVAVVYRQREPGAIVIDFIVVN